MLKTVLKFTFATVLCYWLFKNGKLDFSLFSQAFNAGHLWFFGVLILLGRLAFCPMRFKILLDTKSKTPVPYLKVFSFDAIGNLFSVVLPGAAAGDVVRFFYYKGLGPEVTSGMIAAFLTLDRIIGLMGLMGLSVIITMSQYDHFVLLSHELVTLFLINAISFIVLCVLMIFAFSSWFPVQKIETLFKKTFGRWPNFLEILIDIINIKLSLNDFIKCFVLSVFNQVFVMAGFLLLILPFVPENTEFLKIFTILPIGFIGSSLPITPAGLGVGHVLFDNLFKLIDIHNGASLFNLYFVVNIFMCLLGIIPYLTIKKAGNK